LDALFANPGGRSYGFIERIRYTPPEIRTDLHRRALRLWKEMDPELRRHRDIKRTEPSPRADTKVWKKWLKAMYEADTSFEYIGVPRVGEGYISAHIEGARTTSDFIPTNAKGQPNRGSLRDTILRAAAGVLIVPQRYTRNLNRLKLQIAEIRRTQQYDASRFGDENHLGIHEMVEYLASIGVTEDEAESLRPWAAAFIEMDLEKHPHSRHANDLRAARQQARTLIDADQALVLRNITADAPGYYNPRLEQNRAARSARRTRHGEENATDNAAAGPSSVAGPSSATLDRDAPMSAMDDNASDIVHLDYESEQDERMGPA
jgi:hypothetical protein